MKLPKFSQAVYFRLAALLWILIAFGSCFSLGFRFSTYDPGEVMTKASYIFFFFLTAYFFLWMSNKMQQQEFEMPSDAEAEKIIKEFEASSKKSKKR